jgi:hypothetical protein
MPATLVEWVDVRAVAVMGPFDGFDQYILNLGHGDLVHMVGHEGVAGDPKGVTLGVFARE